MFEGKGPLGPSQPFCEPRQLGHLHQEQVLSVCAAGITPSRAKRGEEGAEVGKATAAQGYFFNMRFFLVPLL